MRLSDRKPTILSVRLTCCLILTTWGPEFRLYPSQTPLVVDRNRYLNRRIKERRGADPSQFFFPRPLHLTLQESNFLFVNLV